jgi:hypothetical protein
MKSFQVMIFNAVILIGLGVYGYVISGSPTALISTVIGLILLGLSFPVKNENSTVSHIAVGLTGLAMIMFFVMGILRNNTVIIVMGVVTLLAFLFYISDFIQRRKERNSKTD